MIEITPLLTEWETEIQQLEAAIQQPNPRQQQRQLRQRLRVAYQSRQLLTGLSQHLLT